jgi:hypothetical protein
MKRRTRLNRRTVDIRGLLADREFIKVTSFLLPHKAKVRVLEMLELLQRERTDRELLSSSGQAPSLPEMTDGEVLREITWRVGTLPQGDAEAVGRLIRHLTRWYAERRKKSARTRRRVDAILPRSGH